MYYNSNYSVWYFGKNVNSIADIANLWPSENPARTDLFKQNLAICSVLDLFMRPFFRYSISFHKNGYREGKGSRFAYYAGFENGQYYVHPAANYSHSFS